MNIKALITSALFLGFAFSVQAATVNTVSVSNGGVGDDTCGDVETVSDSGSGGVSVSYLNTTAGCRTDGEAIAFGGGIGVKGSTISAPDAPSLGSTIRASASSRMTDIFVKPTERNATTTTFQIDVGVNAVLDALLFSNVASDAGFIRGSSASVSATVRLDGILRLPFDTTTQTQNFDSSVGVTNDTGDANESENPFALLSPSIRHDWRAPLTVTFILNGRAGAFGANDSTATGLFDSISTLSFSKTGPAFFLPEGFTVDAPDLNIVDNRWIDPRETVPAVPLPAGLPLLVAGLGALAFLRRADRKCLV